MDKERIKEEKDIRQVVDVMQKTETPRWLYQFHQPLFWIWRNDLYWTTNLRVVVRVTKQLVLLSQFVGFSDLIPRES